ARGQVREAHGRVGGVDALAAGSTRAVHVHAHVGRVEVHFDVVGQHGQHLHAGERGVAALLVVGGADAHEAVHAVFALEHAESVAALHLDGGLVEADAFAGHHVEDRDLPAALLGVARVHAV